MALVLEKFVPTLVIGLGGTGSKVLDQLIKYISDEDRVKDLQENNLFEFVAMDTDLGELDALKIKNKIRTSENLVIADYIRVRRREDQAQGKNTLDWLVNESQFPKSFFDFDISSGAGQVRMYSRLAFEKASQNIYQNLESAINRLKSINNKGTATQATNVNIYIICSMAGGTGGGSFLQVAAMVKYILKKNNKQGQVKAYILSPDIYTKGGILPANQLQDIKANAYAVLKEIDAFYKLMMRVKGSYGLFTEQDMEFIFSPHLSIKSHEDFGNSPLDFVYIVDSENTKGSLSIDKGVMFKMYERMIADALYATIFSPISSKQASVENNTIRQRLEASINSTDYPGYGSIGAGRLVFPIDDIAEYLGHRFVSDIICQNWKEMDADFYAELRDYEKAKQVGEERTYPMRHKKYIEYIENKSRAERSPDYIKLAYNLYEKIHKDDESFVDGVENLIAKRIIQILNENFSDGFSGDDVADYNKEESELEISSSIKHPIPNIISNLKSNFNKDTAESQIRQIIDTTESRVKKLRSLFNNNEQSIINSIIKEIMAEDDKLRSKPEDLASHYLIKWLTIDSKKEGMNIFFIRYFLSKEFEKLHNLRGSIENKINQFKEEVEDIDENIYSGNKKTPTQYLEEKLSTKSIRELGLTVQNIINAKKTIIDFIQGTGYRSLDSYTNKYFQNNINLFYNRIRKSVIERLIGLLSYEYKGKDLASENGFLEIIHKTFDYVSNTLEEEFKKETEKLADFSPSVEKMGVTKGVYNDRKAKENIWKNIGVYSGNEVSRIRETYQNMLSGIEKAYRNIQDMLGVMDKEMIKLRRETILKEMTLKFKDDLLNPSREYFKTALNEKYNILTAMREDYMLQGVVEEQEIYKRILQELKNLFEGCAPFAKTYDVSTCQSIATIAYSDELKPYKIEELIGDITNESGTGNVDTLKNKQIILILRSQVGFVIRDFKTIPEYFEAYLNSELARHIDYRWDYQLPEASIVEESFFGKLLLRAHVIEFIRYKQDSSGRILGSSEYVENYFDIRKRNPNEELLYKPFANGFKETYFEFKKLMKTRKDLRFQLLESHNNARKKDASGQDTSYSKAANEVLTLYAKLENQVNDELKSVIRDIRRPMEYVFQEEFSYFIEKNKVTI